MTKAPLMTAVHEKFLKVEHGRDVFVCRVEMGVEQFGELLKESGAQFDLVKGVRMQGMVGHLWGAEVYAERCFGEPCVYGRDEFPIPDGVLWVRKGWEIEE